MTARKRAQIGIVGVGNLGGALARGWLGGADDGSAATLVVFDTDAERVAALAAAFPGRVVAADSARSVASDVDTLVLSVKPQDLGGLVGDVAPALDGDSVVVSTAAGVGLGTLRAGLGPGPGLVRIMPNLAVAMRSGVVAVAPEPGTSAQTMDRLLGLLRPLGMVEVLPERYFDAVTAVTGSGPGFVSLVVEGLEDGAVRAGLPRAVARRFVRGMLTGTAALLSLSTGSAAELKDAVASPGGTTIAGLAVLEERAVRGSLMRAVEAAADRGRELAGGSA